MQGKNAMEKMKNLPITKITAVSVFFFSLGRKSL